MSRSYNVINPYDDSWAERYGLSLVTAEADALGLRLLCDVSAEGLALVQTVLGVRALELAPPANRRVGDRPAVGSLFLPRALLRPLQVYALFLQDGVVEVWEYADGTLFGLTEAQVAAHADDLRDRDTRGLTEAEALRRHQLGQRAWAAGGNLLPAELAEWYGLEARARAYPGVVARYAGAPRNRRGPAGDARGLTHAKML